SVCGWFGRAAVLEGPRAEVVEADVALLFDGERDQSDEAEVVERPHRLIHLHSELVDARLRGRDEIRRYLRATSAHQNALCILRRTAHDRRIGRTRGEVRLAAPSAQRTQKREHPVAVRSSRPRA